MNKDNNELGSRDPAICNKARTKSLSELLIGAYGICFQAVKPSHRHWPQAGRENFAHQGLILGVNGHSLVKLAYVLHRVCSAVVDDKRWLIKALR